MPVLRESVSLGLIFQEKTAISTFLACYKYRTDQPEVKLPFTPVLSLQIHRYLFRILQILLCRYLVCVDNWSFTLCVLLSMTNKGNLSLSSSLSVPLSLMLSVLSLTPFLHNISVAKTCNRDYPNIVGSH